jgi:hypothetical protein
MNANLKSKPFKTTTFMVIVAMLLLSLSGCAPAGEPPTSEVETTTPETPPVTEVVNTTEEMYKAILDDYKSALPSEQTKGAASTEEQSKLVDKMVQLFNQKASTLDLHTLYVTGITQLSPEQADKFTAYAISGMRRNSFEDYTAIEKYSNDREFFDKFMKVAETSGFKYVVLNRDPQSIQDPAVKELVENAKKQGYYVASGEGMLYYLVDFTEFAKYRQYNTPPMASLIETLAIDDLEPMTSDAALMINRNILAARTYGIEKMMSEYQDTRYEQYLAVRFKDHMTMLFYGVNNTPNFSYETNRINEEVIDLFNEIKTIEGSFMAELVKEFMILIEANNGILDDATREKSNALLKKIDDKYGLTERSLTEYGEWMSGNKVAE